MGGGINNESVKLGPGTAPYTPLPVGKVLRAIGYCFEGVWALRVQTAPRLQVLTFAIGIVIAAFLDLSRIEWMLLLLSFCGVLAAEAINTAVEATVDLVTTERHPLAKVAKDTAAASVLFAATGALIVAALIVAPRLGLVGF